MQTIGESMSSSKGQITRVGEFFRKLSPLALLDVEALQFPASYKPGAILFGEKEASPAIFIILSGEVKLSISSSDGKRLILSIAKPARYSDSLQHFPVSQEIRRLKSCATQRLLSLNAAHFFAFSADTLRLIKP